MGRHSILPAIYRDPACRLCGPPAHSRIEAPGICGRLQPHLLKSQRRAGVKIRRTFFRTTFQASRRFRIVGPAVFLFGRVIGVVVANSLTLQARSSRSSKRLEIHALSSACPAPGA